MSSAADARSSARDARGNGVPRRVGDRAVLIEVDDNERALALAARIGERFRTRVDEVVPGHRTVLVTGVPDESALALELGSLAQEPVPRASAAAELVTLDVRYDGPDLDAVAALAGMSREEVARRHAAARYRVAFVGFAPGFAYLLGGDERLAMPRHTTPRTQVAPGSLGLAGPYTAVYPSSSPGGWQLIGTATGWLFDVDRDPPARLQPGAEVRFQAL